MINVSPCEAVEWAAALIKCGANIAQVDRELGCCNVSPASAKLVRGEFTKQTLEAMAVAQRGREQWPASNREAS